MPSSTTSVMPSFAHAVGDPFDFEQLVEHALGDRQPAEAVGDLGRARRRPQGGVASARRSATRCSRAAPSISSIDGPSAGGSCARRVRSGSLTPRS